MSGRCRPGDRDRDYKTLLLERPLSVGPEHLQKGTGRRGQSSLPGALARQQEHTEPATASQARPPPPPQDGRMDGCWRCLREAWQPSTALSKVTRLEGVLGGGQTWTERALPDPQLHCRNTSKRWLQCGALVWLGQSIGTVQGVDRAPNPTPLGGMTSGELHRKRQEAQRF